jgi:hypothetical protein
MATTIRVSLILSVLLLCGCPGGGGSIHHPPDSIAYGEAMKLRLELSVWGAGFGKMANRYTEIRCHYKSEKAKSFSTLEGKVESEAKDRLFVVFELPAFSEQDGAFVEYYIDSKLDGHYNKRDLVRVNFK